MINHSAPSGKDRHPTIQTVTGHHAAGRQKDGGQKDLLEGHFSARHFSAYQRSLQLEKTAWPECHWSFVSKRSPLGAKMRHPAGRTALGECLLHRSTAPMGRDARRFQAPGPPPVASGLPGQVMRLPMVFLQMSVPPLRSLFAFAAKQVRHSTAEDGGRACRLAVKLSLPPDKLVGGGKSALLRPPRSPPANLVGAKV